MTATNDSAIYSDNSVNPNSSLPPEACSKLFVF